MATTSRLPSRYQVWVSSSLSCMHHRCWRNFRSLTLQDAWNSLRSLIHTDCPHLRMRKALLPTLRSSVRRCRSISARNRRCFAIHHSYIVMTSACRPHRWDLSVCLPRVRSMCSDGSHLTMSTTAHWLQTSSYCCVTLTSATTSHCASTTATGQAILSLLTTISTTLQHCLTKSRTSTSSWNSLLLASHSHCQVTSSTSYVPCLYAQR